MKKDKILYAISILLIIVFFVITLLDYSNYDATVNSAPFTADILVRALEFVLPSIIILIIALFMSKKNK